jgi:DNA-nicking Smr family endonuclease
MEAVTAFVQAKPEQGGAGALVVLISDACRVKSSEKN